MKDPCPTHSHETTPQKMQDCLWEHYQSDAVLYFDLSYPRLDFLASHFKNGQSILNIGVGNGYLEERLHKNGIDIHTLDPSEKAIEQLKEKIPLGSKAQVGYCQAIPFPSNAFDGVIMTEVLEHLMDDALIQAVAEVRRVLKPGGIFIGTVPYNEDLNANRVICPCCHIVFHRWGHHQCFDKNKLVSLLSTGGFCIREAYPRAFPDWARIHPKLLMKSILRYVLGRLGEQIVSPNLFFLCEKNF
ncbi:MAG: class I SAM-dependent methyltransferase [Deltaproteobacteria bacterium]|nr:class I SAM-dependent methyltransferase [Deltaproteobacteria bacterium]